jgi:tetratricopeptide (TPR) repeat protein
MPHEDFLSGPADGALPDPRALLAREVLGLSVPADAERQIILAGATYADSELAEEHLREAARLAPGHAAVLIARYRYLFYKHRLDEAREVARLCIDRAIADNGFGCDWFDVTAEQADFADMGAVLPRFFLFALKGWSYLNLRLGDIGEGVSALAKMLELDPADRLGARLLLAVIADADPRADL